MAIAAPSIQIAAQAAFNSPGSYVAGDLFPRCPIPGAAMRPGQNAYVGTAYRAPKNQNRKQPGELSLEMVPGRAPPRLFTSLEDYEVSSKVYEVETPISEYARPTLDKFGVQNYERDVVTPQLVSALLQDREVRALAIASNTANFGGNTAGNWGDDTNDPIEQLDVAIRLIEQGFGTLGPEHALHLVLSDDAFRALRNNAKVRSRFNIVQDSPATPEEIGGYVAKILTLGASGIGFRIKVAKATGAPSANEGQGTAPAYLYANKAALVVAAKASTTPLASIERAAALQSSSQADLRYRSWGRGYVMLDPTITSRTDEATNELFYRGAHATSDTLYDSTGGYLWTAPANS